MTLVRDKCCMVLHSQTAIDTILEDDSENVNLLYCIVTAILKGAAIEHGNSAA